MPQVDLSFTSIFAQATGVVQAVLVILVLCSILCWSIILEKAVALISLRRQTVAFERWTATADASFARHDHGGLGGAALATGRVEWADIKAGESAADRRDRIERAMRDTVVSELLRAEARLAYLATIGSAAPFIGLFGTVWGIMHAFTNIAQTNDTSLAVVAPGIAEALSTTAIGLVAAIPASIAYNKLAGDFGALARGLSLTIAAFVRRAADLEAGSAR